MVIGGCPTGKTPISPAKAASRRERGQMSFEALLLFLVFLTLLAIAYTAAGNVGSAAQKKTALSLSQSDFNEFSAKMAQACSLGDGNVRIAEMRGNKATLAASGQSVTFSAGNFSATASPACEIVLLQGEPAGFFRIKNTLGKIEIS